jgi:chromosome segregation ATPase
VDGRRRLEAELASKQEEIDELTAEIDVAMEKERKAILDHEQASLAVAAEKDAGAKMAQRLQVLEKANAELREQVEAALRDGDKKLKTRIVPLEAKVAAMQAELEQEQRKAADAVNKYKRVERKGKETQRLLEESEKAAAEHKANYERVNSKIRNQQSQIEELEAEVNTLRQKNRRLQTDVNEATEMSEQLRSQLASTQARNARMAMRRRGSILKDEADDVQEAPLAVSEGQE